MKILTLTLTVSIPDGERKSYIFIFTHYIALKGFIKALKAFIKPFEASQRSAKIRIEVYFDFNTIF